MKRDEAGGTDVLVLCAIDDERDMVVEAMTRCLNVKAKKSRPHSNLAHISLTSFQFRSNGRKFGISVACAGRMGLTYAGIVTVQLLEKLRPRLAIMCGIAGAASKHHGFGDVLVAESAMPYRFGRINADGTFQPDGPSEAEAILILPRFHTASTDTPAGAKMREECSMTKGQARREEAFISPRSSRRKRCVFAGPETGAAPRWPRTWI